MTQQVCDPERLMSFLRGDLTAAAERDLTSHLDECASCGQALEQRVAAAFVWREAGEFLGDEDLDDPGTCLPGHETNDPQISQVLSQLAPTDDPDSLGRIGGYEVAGVIGSGGMGVVLKARDSSLDRVVAVKVMAPHLAASGSARQRFAREAKAAAAVLHPNVIAIHGVTQEAELPYLVMPYVRGESLQKRLQKEGPLPLVDILRIGAQVAAGLAAAHQQGLVHRDIKPANILLEEGVERVTITDFGLARAVDDASLTRSGAVAGTPLYMSPEQARGEPVDARSDLFSLGTLLYTMCTGHSPFRAETSFGVMHRIIQDPPRPITEINADVPLWMEACVTKLLAKRPEDRFSSAKEVAALLEGCLAHTQRPTTTPLPDRVAQLTPPPIRRRWGFALAAAGALLGLPILAGILIILQLGTGTLRIESEMDDVPIRIMQGNKVVERLTVSRDGTSTRIAAGEYRVLLDWTFDRAVVSESTVSISRNGTEVVRVTRRGEGSTGGGPSSDALESPRWFASPAHKQAVSDLTRIINGLHRYQKMHGRLPTSVVHGKDGKAGPPHSWRVELLPLLGEQELYDQYHFDEPWDSAHNKLLLSKMPAVFRSPQDHPQSNFTSYFGITSNDISPRAAALQAMREQRDGKLEADYEQYVPEATVFWKRLGASFIDMLDGTSSCIAVVEARREIPWTQPVDINYASDALLPRFGGWFDDGWHAAFADGTVKQLATYNDAKSIRNMLTISDGQAVTPRLTRRLRIHEVSLLPEGEREAVIGQRTYQVPGGPLLWIRTDQVPLFTEADLLAATSEPDPNNRSVGEVISMTLTEEAGARFLAATTRLSEQRPAAYLAILFDGEIWSAPRVVAPIGAKLTITGLQGKESADTLAAKIREAVSQMRDRLNAPQSEAENAVELQPVQDTRPQPANGRTGRQD